MTAVAAAAGLLDREGRLPERPADEVIAATGSVAWLCTAVVDHLLLAFARYSRQAGALGGGQVSARSEPPGLDAQRVRRSSAMNIASVPCRCGHSCP